MHASGSSVFLFFLTIAELAVFLEYRSRDCDFGESFWFYTRKVYNKSCLSFRRAGGKQRKRLRYGF